MPQNDNSWTSRARLSRRRFAGGAAALGAGVLGIGLTGCGSSSNNSSNSGSNKASSANSATQTAASPRAAASGAPAGSPAAQTPKKGGELIAGLGGPTSQSLDPHKTVNLGFSYYGYYLNRFIAPDSHTIIPYHGELVESWEQVDKTTYNFKTRQGVTWHDGKPAGGRALNAQDIAFNLMRIAGKTDPSHAALYQRATNLYGMDKAEAVDNTTTKLTFSTPNSAFLAGLGDWRNWAIPPEQVDKDPDFKDPANFAGTGPFIVNSWDSANVAGRYVANPKYWKQGKPYVASVQQVSLPDAASTEAAFLSGKIDWLSVAQLTTRADVQKAGASSGKIYNWENLLYDFMGLNQSRPPFTDPRVRQAIFKAIDYTSLGDSEYGKDFWSYTGVLVSGLPGAPTADQIAKTSPWSPATKQQDIADAKQLMTAAGYADGGVSFKILPSSTAGSGYDYSVRIQDQLSKIWPALKVQITPPADGAAFAKDLSAGNWDAVTYVQAPPPDAIFGPAQFWATGGSRNYTKFSDQQIDGLVSQLFQEFDDAARAKLFTSLAQRMMDVVVYVPICKSIMSIALRSRVQGFDGFSGVGTDLYSYEFVNAAEQLWIA